MRLEGGHDPPCSKYYYHLLIFLILFYKKELIFNIVFDFPYYKKKYYI
jgi:hypothetical protein